MKEVMLDMIYAIWSYKCPYCGSIQDYNGANPPQILTCSNCDKKVKDKGH